MDNQPVSAQQRRVLLSVALNVPQHVPADFFGHEIAYQRALTTAAAACSVDAVVLVPAGTEAEIPNVVSLAGDPKGSWVVRLDEELRARADQRVTVLIYEGDLEKLRFTSHMAALHPEVVFVVNLFSGDPELTVPSLSERRLGRRLKRLRSSAGADGGLACFAVSVPDNVVVYADTERRRMLASSIGLSDVSTWPLYSVVESAQRQRPSTPEGLTRVVIPVAGRQATRQVAYELSCVVDLCRRYASAGHEFDWYVFGGGYERNWRMRVRARRLARLRRLGVRFDPHGLSGDEYHQALAEADVVWLPKRGTYTTTSSGKAADTLVSGTPILAPNGSFPAQEMERWVSGAPAYTGVREAVEVFIRAESIFPALRQSRAECLEEVRWWYSPKRAITEIMEASERLHGQIAQRERPQLPEDSALPPPPSVRSMIVETRRERLRRIMGTRAAQLQAAAIEGWVRLSTLLRMR